MRYQWMMVLAADRHFSPCNDRPLLAPRRPASRGTIELQLGANNMKKITLVAALVVAPAIASAQSKVQTQSNVNASAAVSSHAGKSLSVEGQAKVDANLKAARERGLPEAPIRRRVAEGEAKGASEAQIVSASGKTLADLQASYDAMVRAGRTKPNEEEITRGSQLVVRGYTTAQIEAVVQKTPSDRSLVVAFETLTALRARGVSSERAVAQVGSRLAARATDAELRGLAVDANVVAGANAGLGVGHAAGAAAGKAHGGAAATAAGSAAAGASHGAAHGVGAAAGGAVSGAVGGVLGKRP